jgi:hypothetical protein
MAAFASPSSLVGATAQPKNMKVENKANTAISAVVVTYLPDMYSPPFCMNLSDT